MENRKVVKPLTLLELNEVNFDVVRQYLSSNILHLPNLKKVLAGKFIRTSAEKEYSELEPWIQWVSVHTGLSYSEHGVFRLGDMVQSRHRQFFEVIEDGGFRVGVISAINTSNKLVAPAYFVPDPWTKTSPDSSFWSKILAQAFSQAVNDNAKFQLSLKTIFFILIGLLRFAKIKHYLLYLKLALTCRAARWRRALFFDLFLHDVHLGLYKSKKPDLSVLFLNAGAHIQHHYFLSSAPIKSLSNLRNPDWYIKDDQDPVAELLKMYDLILGEYFELSSELIIATGLSQSPYDRIKHYYRLKNHAEFLKLLGIEFRDIYPRMTRDFLINFESNEQALKAEKILSSIKIVSDKTLLFGEIDNRGSSLFVTLTYPNMIDVNTQIILGANKEINLLSHVVFVAIKNGMHQENGFAFFSDGIPISDLKDGGHVKYINKYVCDYFFKN